MTCVSGGQSAGQLRIYYVDPRTGRPGVADVTRCMDGWNWSAAHHGGVDEDYAAAVLQVLVALREIGVEVPEFKEDESSAASIVLTLGVLLAVLALGVFLILTYLLRVG